MKNNTSGIFRRISILVFCIITVLSVVFILMTYFAATYFYKASTQLLNKDVATHIAKFTSPFEKDIINKEKAENVFYNAMVVNPSIEVYFLDTSGKVLYYQSPDTVIQLSSIPLSPIKDFIASKGEKFVTNYDPKHAGEKKIFSAAEVHKKDELLGYIYVILGSSAYGQATNMLFGSQVWRVTIEAFIIVVILSLLISLYYIRRLQRSYKQIINVLEEYEAGNFDARFALKDDNEFAPITQAFSKMSALLSTNIRKLQKSEGDRKDLIAIISHDLQSPLSIIKGYAETILMHNNLVADQQKEYLLLIQSKIMQAQKMVMQLTELSKIEEANFKPNKESFVLSEIVQETVNVYRLVAAEKNIDIECTQCQNHIWVYADINLMERVIQNLVDNAVKNTVSPETIYVSLQTETDHLHFTIENGGKALSAKLLTWINNKEEELADKPHEAGLGLLIAKKILRLHQLSLQAASNQNKNIFSFKIPIIKKPVSG